MLNRIAPKSLYGRTILIVVLPIFMMQAVITYIFFNRHWEEVTATLARTTAGDIGLLTTQWKRAMAEGDAAALIDLAREDLEIEMSFVQGGAIPDEDERSIFNALNRVLDRELDWFLDDPYWYDTQGFDEAVETRVQLADGYLTFRVTRDRVMARNGHFFVLWLIGTTLLLGYVALVFLRNQVRSITRLAAAADAFGRGLDAADFKPTGAREVRLAGHAFVAMRQRIRRYLEQRTEMLAGVSHDLKTPLTRLRLQLALGPDTPETDDMRRDLDEMERLLDTYLTFARDEAEGGTELVDLKSIAEDVARNAQRLGQSVRVDAPSSVIVAAQTANLHRAVTNLVENALKFGTEVQLSVAPGEQEVTIAVDDDGPGIAPEDREDAVKAFGRLDKARNSNIAGSGLGLAIVRDVARAHGGALRLEVSAMGGLRAVIALPPPTPDG